MRPERCLIKYAPLSAFVGFIFLVGCGGETNQNLIHLSGLVTIEDKPLPVGLIVFEPDPAKNNRGPQGHANIKDGRFDTKLSGKMAVIGAQVIRITGGDGVNPEPFTPFGKLLFEEHTVRMDISKGQQPLQINVPGNKTDGK